MRTTARQLLFSAVTAAALVGCKQDDAETLAPPSHDVAASLARFSDCSDLRDYATRSFLEYAVQAKYGYGYMLEDSVAGAESDSSAPSADGGSSGPRDYSSTNNQEVGVDEADLVKTDGNYLYVVQPQGELTIVKSWPAAETAVVGRLDIGGYPSSMFLKGDRAVIFSSVYSYDGLDGATVPSDFSGTRLTIVDVTDRTAPVIQREIDLEGYMTTGRMINDDVYVVLQSYTNAPSALWELIWGATPVELPAMDWSGTEEDQEAIRQSARELLYPRVKEIVDAMPIEDLLPAKYDHLPGEVVDAEPMLTCGDVYHNEGVSYPSILSVVNVNLESDNADSDGSDVAATGLMADGWNVYASENNLYVAQTSYWWWWGYGDLDLETHIHRFALDGADTTYEASNKVTGWIKDQFSMSEYDGYLRVATTDIDWWWGSGATDDAAEPANNVFVLNAGSETMEKVGEVRGIAPNEQIYASRFLGDRGYIVTFRQVDPLFTLDLSDPTAPKVVGELKIPGYSSYLHPIGEDYLLAVGMAGTESGDITGFAVNLFDVSDPTAPSQKDQLIVESDNWSYSESLWNHLAFTFHRNVLSVPMYTYDWDEVTGEWDGFSGLLAVKVDTESGLTEAGRVSHEDLVAESRCLYETYGTPSEGSASDSSDGGAADTDPSYDPCADYYWYAWMKRSVAIENYVYSISDYGIKVNDAENPSTEVARVLFWPGAAAR